MMFFEFISMSRVAYFTARNTYLKKCFAGRAECLVGRVTIESEKVEEHAADQR